MEANIIFIISAFALGVVLILMRERIPQQLKRGLAITSMVFILFAFFLIVYTFATMGD